MSDCKHVQLKCMKCMRKMPDDFQITKIQISDAEGNQYPPAIAEIGGADEGFHIEKGPLSIEVNFTDEGVVVDIWDSTEEGAMDPIASTYEFYTSCEDPHKHQADPTQLKIGGPDWGHGPCGSNEDE